MHVCRCRFGIRYICYFAPSWQMRCWIGMLCRLVNALTGIHKYMQNIYSYMHWHTRSLGLRPQPLLFAPVLCLQRHCLCHWRVWPYMLSKEIYLWVFQSFEISASSVWGFFPQWKTEKKKLFIPSFGVKLQAAMYHNLLEINQWNRWDFSVCAC